MGRSIFTHNFKILTIEYILMLIFTLYFGNKLGFTALSIVYSAIYSVLYTVTSALILLVKIHDSDRI